MAMQMTQEYWWKISLRLKLRQSSGDHFQDFFSGIMEKLHGSDFVRVRSFGAAGDKGCDGYLQSSGRLFQCYGAVNGDKSKVQYLIRKMSTDFRTAKTELGAIMKEWHMVHNLIDGLPIKAIETLEQLKRDNGGIGFGFVGLEGFEERIEALTIGQKTELLGPAATNQDAQDLQVQELKFLVDALVRATEDVAQPSTEVSPVPADKLEANELPNYWTSLILNGWRSAHVVASYFDRHHDPLLGERIARLFRDRYRYLKSQNLTPATIMDGLYEYVTGVGSVLPARQVAAQALLAHLFESCDILENSTSGGAS